LWQRSQRLRSARHTRARSRWAMYGMSCAASIRAPHAGDWLVKALFFSVVFSMWHLKQEKEKQA